MTESNAGNSADGKSRNGAVAEKPVRSGLFRFSIALFITAILMSASWAWLRHCLWMDFTAIPVLGDLDSIHLFNPVFLVPAFASAFALLSGAAFTDIYRTRRLLLLISALIFLASLVAAWQELAGIPKSMLKAIGHHNMYGGMYSGPNGIESILGWTIKNSLRVTGLVLLPGLFFFVLLKFVAARWIARLQSSVKQFVPVLLISTAVVLLLVRFAMLSIQNESRPSAGLAEFHFGDIELLLMGTFAGCLAIGAFLPKRLPIALLFSAVFTLVAVGVEVGLTSHRSADLGPTFYALAFSVFYLPVAFLLRRNSRTSGELKESGKRLVLAAMPAALLGAFFWIAGSHVDFMFLAFSRDLQTARLASEVAHCGIMLKQHDNYLTYTEESRADFPARILPMMVKFQKTNILKMRSSPDSLEIRRYFVSDIAEEEWVVPDFAPLYYDHFPGNQFETVLFESFQVSNREQAIQLAELGRNRNLEVYQVQLRGKAADYDSLPQDSFDFISQYLTIAGAASLLPAITGLTTPKSITNVHVDISECDVSAIDFFTAFGEMNRFGSVSLKFSGSSLGAKWNSSDLHFDDSIWKDISIGAQVDADGRMPDWLANLILQEKDHSWPSVELDIPGELATNNGVQWIRKLEMASGVPLRFDFGKNRYPFAVLSQEPKNQVIGWEGDYVLKTGTDGRPEALCIVEPDWGNWKIDREKFAGVKSVLTGYFWNEDYRLFGPYEAIDAKAFPRGLDGLEELYLGESVRADYEFIEALTGLRTLQVTLDFRQNYEDAESLIDAIQETRLLERLIVVCRDPRPLFDQLKAKPPASLQRLDIVLADRSALGYWNENAWMILGPKIKVTVTDIQDIAELYPECLQEFRRELKRELLERNAQLGANKTP